MARQSSTPPSAAQAGRRQAGRAGAQVRARDPETGELAHGRRASSRWPGRAAWSATTATSGDAPAFTADGFLRTGDLGQLDPDGGFIFLSRMGDALRLRGFLVNPPEIEVHIQELPGIEGAR